MLIVDDHLALLAVTGRLPYGLPAGPVATTYCFHFRLSRAVADSERQRGQEGLGALSRLAPGVALARVLAPPPDRLVVLDDRSSLAEAVDVATRHTANLLLAQLVGAARHHAAAVRVTAANCGRSWKAVMRSERIDFATV
ncbi:MAG: hypothetical protein ACRD1K_13525 [Acidimicrobiales bacterium]